jgi:putative Mg2+ transporter-C (MgtC) family protein
MDSLSDFTIAPLHWEGLLTTLLCGAIIGLERQLSGKPAGIRTSCLICMGTYIFVASSISLTGGSIDPSRVIGQVVTGIGFLGAGVILTREGAILGVTSAATIWVLAAIGVVAGLERHAAAIVLALVTIGILVGVNLLERSFRALRRGVHAQIVAKYRRRRDDDPELD